ncbi:hypothetical protein B0H17DRAFT_1198090 [Mycena rosella]|uniref:ZW10 C-terminal helical domain-containing protein n=1 Tax=Mycena rosella TaxID=1033263 RepID=A0AAD7DPF2_MYCRO|nr:hypothetical protein B0H17DRAFT_1198090 [Mycena rosella]
MAFPVPAHLPRRANPQDVSSEILMKIDQATNQTLTASLATSWLAELEATIQATKSHIHDRIHVDLPKFEQQFESSKSVQTRLQSLASNVDGLSHTLSDPETGLVPTLVRSLTAHASLAQQSADATVRHETLSHLLRCRTEFGSVLSLVQLGKLPQAVEACGEFEQMFRDAPAHLHQTNVMVDLKRKFQATKSRVEEQLSEAYTRSVTVSPKYLEILPSVVVRQSDSVLSLPDVLSSLSTNSLSSHLATLRRDIMTYYVDHFLRQPTSLTVSSDTSLTIFPSPPNSEDLTTRIDNVSATLKFLSTHFMVSLPSSEAHTFSRSLCKPIVTSVLTNLLVPSLPSSFDLLPQFLSLSKHALAFEDEYVVQLLGDDKSDRPIKAWVDGMGGHYERQRRVQILETSRIIILAPESAPDRFLVEVNDKMPEVVPVQSEEGHDASWGFEDEEKPVNGGAADDGDGWGFDDDAEPKSAPAAADVTPAPSAATEDVEDDGWGFDEEETDPAPDPQEPPATNGHHEPEPDAWGWNDDDAQADSTEDTVWDDPWSDPPEKPSAVKNPRPPPAPSITPNTSLSSPASTSSPKMATRLEKLANKGKKHLNGSSPMSSPALSTPISSSPKPTPATPSLPPPPPPATVKSPEKRPPRLSTSVAVPKEMYLVSGRVRQIINIVEDVLIEGRKFAASKILPAIETSSPPGTVLLQSAASILDLYRALYPVKFAGSLKSAQDAPMQFSNDCLYLSGEIARVEGAARGDALAPVKDRLGECRHRLKILGDSWFEDTVEQHRQSANDTIARGAEGFTFTADQDRYDECESAISRAVQEVKRLAQRWKGILNKSKYYTAIGMVTDAALSRVLEDVLALPDIPEVESHRLSELCRILHGLEALFEPFVVAYVPSWLKFSYLSELLEASMVDISYLFDSGALVDFEVDELVGLVRALFADTALRTNTINKLTGGRP